MFAVGIGFGTLHDLAEAGLGTAPETKPRKFGDYELLQEIAHGGMGIVFRAFQCSLKRFVAVKMLLLGSFASPTSISRFRREAEAIATLIHPNIVSIYEIGEIDGHSFFSMEFINGPTLAKRLETGPLPTRTAATYLRKIALAVHHAHSHGILHRDLKPSNILIDGLDEPKVTDFGLAKRITDQPDNLTLPNQMLGTPNYLPPEVAAGLQKEIGPASDTFSLGAVLYECIAGRPPFLSETIAETLSQIRECQFAKPSLLAPKVPKDLETICLKCLQKEPVRRYATALDLANDLQRFLNAEPIHARPVSRFEKAWRWSQREPALAVSGLAIGILLSFIVLATIAYASRLRTQLRESIISQARATRLSNRVGRHFETLKLVARAERLDPTPQELVQLREEALHAISFSDIREISWKPPNVQSNALFCFADSTPLYAVANPDGLISVRQFHDHSTVAEWRTPDRPSKPFTLNSTGTHLVIGGKDGINSVWDIKTRSSIFSVDTIPLVSPDGHNVVTFEEGSIVLRTLNDNIAIHRFHLDITNQFHLNASTNINPDIRRFANDVIEERFSPDGKYLLFSSPAIDGFSVLINLLERTISVLRETATNSIKSGNILKSPVLRSAWHRDRHQVAVNIDRRVLMFDGNGTLVEEVATNVTELAYVGTNSTLVLRSGNYVTLTDGRTRQELNGMGIPIHPFDTFTTSAVDNLLRVLDHQQADPRIFEIYTSTSFDAISLRRLSPDTVRDPIPHELDSTHGVMSPDGTLFAWWREAADVVMSADLLSSQVHRPGHYLIFDLTSRSLLGQLSLPISSTIWFNADSTILYTIENGFRSSAPIVKNANESSIGQSTRLNEFRIDGVIHAVNGNHSVVFKGFKGDVPTVCVVDVRDGKELLSIPLVLPVLSNDGRSLIGFGNGLKTVELWDIETKAKVRSWPFGRTYGHGRYSPCFSRNSRVVCVISGSSVFTFDTLTKKETAVSFPEVHHSVGTVALSPDGTEVVAIYEGGYAVFIGADSGTILARLQLPISRWNGSGLVSFDRNGERLFVLNDGVLTTWNRREAHQTLAKLGIGWH